MEERTIWAYGRTWGKKAGSQRRNCPELSELVFISALPPSCMPGSVSVFREYGNGGEARETDPTTRIMGKENKKSPH